MSQRKIFLSCVNRELKSYRLKAEVIIQHRDYEPVFEEKLKLDDQTALNTLKSRIAECDAVVCLVGDAYGGELRIRPVDQPRRSFTQWEYFFAQELNKPIYRLATHPDTPTDDQTAQPPLDPEAAELRELQANFRRQVLDDQNFREFRNVHQLEKELALLRFAWEPGTGWHKPFIVPFPSLGSLFKGREEVLTKLHHQLQSTASRTAAVTQVVHGLGGVGKTRLAIEYAYRCANDYCAVLFASADTPTSLESSLAALVAKEALDLPEQAPETKPAEQAAAVMRWLKNHTGWLLILDNIDTDEASAAVRARFRGLAGGALLLTGRIGHYPADVHPVPLDLLTTPAAAEYLLQATEGQRRPHAEDPGDAMELAEEMGGLALAVEQAAAFIRTRHIRLRDYRDRWRAGERRVQDWHNPQLMNYPRSVLVAWDTTFDQLDPAPRALLEILAWFAPEPIPREIFATEKAQQFFTILVASDPAPDLEEALATLEKYSLVKWDETHDHFSLHRLVQDVTRQKQSDEQQKVLVLTTAKLWNAFLPGDPPPHDVRSWDRWKPAAPHVASLVWSADQRQITDPTSRLMNNLGLFEKAVGRFIAAERLYRRSLTIDEQSFGSDHPNVAICLNNLAQSLQDTNRLAEAEPLMRRVLAIDEQSFGPNHPNVAIGLNNLATLLLATNRLSEAEPLMRRALEIDEQSFGPDHPNVARDLNNLAQLLKATNRLSEAESLLRRALEIDERYFRSDHPKVAIRLTNLATLLFATNRLSEAEPVMRRALTIDERCFGSDHPTIAIDLNNLAQVLQATNRLPEAESLMRRALTIDELSLGSDHPAVAISLNNLALLLQATNRLSEAEALMRKALAIFEQSFGPNHPNVATNLSNLAHLLQATNRMSEAEPLMRRALAIGEQSFRGLVAGTLLLTGHYPAEVHPVPRNAFVERIKTFVVELLKSRAEPWIWLNEIEYIAKETDASSRDVLGILSILSQSQQSLLCLEFVSKADPMTVTGFEEFASRYRQRKSFANKTNDDWDNWALETLVRWRLNQSFVG